MTPKSIGIVGFNGVTALHMVGPAEAFTAAALDDGYGGRIPCYKVSTISVSAEHLETESGFTLTTRCTLRDAPELDTIIVAGGAGIQAASVTDALTPWLLERALVARRFGSICTGLYGLAPTGLLNGREVTTHWRSARDVAARFPQLRVNHQKALVQDGRFFTSSGLSAGLNLPLAMIQEDYGPYVARAVERELFLRVSSPAEGPRRDSAPVDDRPADRFGDLVGWIIRNLQSDLSVDVLARRACMCPSHFSKAFKSVFGSPPTDFVEGLRLNEARRRLSKRQKTLQSVATSVGFNNADAFQRAFERRFGMRPSNFFEERAKVPARVRKARTAQQATETALASPL